MPKNGLQLDVKCSLNTHESKASSPVLQCSEASGLWEAWPGQRIHPLLDLVGWAGRPNGLGGSRKWGGKASAQSVLSFWFYFVCFSFLKPEFLLCQTGLTVTVPKADFELLIFLSQPPQYWDYRCEPAHLAWRRVFGSQNPSPFLSLTCLFVFFIFFFSSAKGLSKGSTSGF